jgi:phosphohistidine phosphatase
MKRLTLVRHGNAAWKDSQASDFDRPLTRRGQSESTVLGRLLARGHLTPDLLISSTAQRARQTAEIVARELALPANVLRFEESLYLAEAVQILQVARSPGPKLSHLMIVGHNPCISELARQLAPRADIPELDTATACTMTFDVATWQAITPGAAIETRLEPRSQQLPAFWP